MNDNFAQSARTVLLPRIQATPVLRMALLCVLASSALLAQPLRFVEETIRIQVHGDSCILDGTYTFRNEGGERLAFDLVYPFPKDPDLPLPTTIAVTDTSSVQPVSFTPLSGAVMFCINVAPHGTAAYRVRYVQQTPAAMMRYILTSTRRWGRPLERATYVVVVPHTFTLRSSTLAADTVWSSGSETTYLTRKNTFMPQRDLTVRWIQRRSR